MVTAHVRAGGNGSRWIVVALAGFLACTSGEQPRSEKGPTQELDSPYRFHPEAARAGRGTLVPAGEPEVDVVRAPPLRGDTVAASGTYYTYIRTSKSHAIYVGMTNNLIRRVNGHRQEGQNGYCGKCNINKLVYFEEFSNPRDAIECEKMWKGWIRVKKDALVNQVNPHWHDLTDQLI